MPQQQRIRVIPVIDLMGGQVVRGVGGNRDGYRPVESCLARDPSPAAVAEAFVRELSTTEVYVADLDAIRGGEPDWKSLDQIAACGPRIWLDCGIGTARIAGEMRKQAAAKAGLERLVVGLESIPRVSELSAVGEVLQSDTAIFSLDLKRGRPLTESPELMKLSALQIAEVAWDAGFRSVLVLDLAFVGTGQGVHVAELCQQLRSRFPALEILAGGGIRSKNDIRSLADAGCNGVLVASALHNGSIVAGDLDFGRS